MKRSTLLFFIGFGVPGLHVLPHLQAVVPPPDGGYRGNNTATGVRAIFSNTNGLANTDYGNFALFKNTIASFNTAIGHDALTHNTTGIFNIAIGSHSGANLVTKRHPDGKGFVMRTDERLTAFLELKSVISGSLLISCNGAVGCGDISHRDWLS
jgi:hypothetical protein